MIRTSVLALLLTTAASAAAAAQPADPHAGHQMPSQSAAPADPRAGHAMPAQGRDPHAGHAMPAEPASKAVDSAQPPEGAPANPHAGHLMPAPPADPHAGHQMGPPPAAADPHAGHAMPAPADPHAGHAMAPAAGQTGADLTVGGAPPPPVITDNAADRVFGSGPMQRARGILANEHGAARIAKVQADLLEWAPDGGAYSWQVEGWYGGDINRLVFKSEGEGKSRDGVEAAEVQLLYSRAVARYTDVQLGLRYDVEPRARAYATHAVDAMFPYWFEAEGALFLSEKGDLLARVEGSYDWRLTQRLILQPRAELELAAQDIPEREIGSGLSSGQLGLRLRYELRREFAPYIGITYERTFGDTASFARTHGEDVESTRFVVGLRAWF
jgi:copper resistance protein B